MEDRREGQTAEVEEGIDWQMRKIKEAEETEYLFV